MKNLKHPYPFALLLGLSLCAPHLQAADAGQAVGQISATVPKILLLDVKNQIEGATTTMSYSAPTKAGNKLVAKAPVANSLKVAFTSNVDNAYLYAHAEVTKLNNNTISQSLSESNLALNMLNTIDGAMFALPDIDDDSYRIFIGNNVSGIMANTPHRITLFGGLANATTGIASHGDYEITVTYTLKEV